MKLVKGKKYDVRTLALKGWKGPRGSDTSGYNLYDYFDSRGAYLGADKHRISPVVSRKRGNPSRKPTKAQRAAKAKKAATARRVASALANFLKQANPGTKYEAAGYRKTKTGYSIITRKAPKKGNR